MATQLTLYNQVAELLGKGAVDFSADTIKLALVTSAYTFNAEHDEWADASAAELADASYTAGGNALASKTVTRSGAVATFDAADLTFATLSGTFRMGILYAVGSFMGKTNPVIGMILFDSTPANIVLSGVNFSVVWNASGIFTIGS